MKLEKIVSSHSKRLEILRMLSFLPDSVYLKLIYKIKMGKKLNLKNPQTFNEKLQWLKIYDRKPEYTTMVDKYEVKKYVADKIGEEHIIPTLGVWDNFDDIDFEKLPNQFVLKCTHDSGSIVICKDKKNLDINAAREKLTFALNYNAFDYGREWPYKNVKPRIIAEKYMVDEETNDLRDYKFFCFDGSVKCLLICSNRYNNNNMSWDYFDEKFNSLNFTQMGMPHSNTKIEKPLNYDKMINICEILSNNIPFIRVDLYECNKKIYFGELTFSTTSGYGWFEPEEWDYKLGSYIKLPIDNK